MKKELNNKKQFAFPPQEEIERVKKEIFQTNHRVNFLLKPNATPMDKAKYQLCKSISYFQEEKKLSEKELGKMMEIDERKLEHVLFCHINKFTLDKLINYANNLHINTEIKIPIPYDRDEKATANTH